MELKKSTLRSISYSVILCLVFVIGAESSLCDDDSSTNETPSNYNAPSQENEQKENAPVFTNDDFEEDSVDVDMNDVFDNSDY